MPNATGSTIAITNCAGNGRSRRSGRGMTATPYLDTTSGVALRSRAMGRILAIGIAVAAACIAVIAANGPGKDKPEDKDTLSPRQESAQVAPTEPKAAAALPGATVRMKNLRFKPSAVRIELGQSV